jgi:hypothetical protein
VEGVLRDDQTITMLVNNAGIGAITRLAPNNGSGAFRFFWGAPPFGVCEGWGLSARRVGRVQFRYLPYKLTAQSAFSTFNLRFPQLSVVLDASPHFPQLIQPQTLH